MITKTKSHRTVKRTVTAYKCDACGKEFDAKRDAENHHFHDHVLPNIVTKHIDDLGDVYKFDDEQQFDLYYQFMLSKYVDQTWDGPGWYYYDSDAEHAYICPLSDVFADMYEEAQELMDRANSIEKFLSNHS